MLNLRTLAHIALGALLLTAAGSSTAEADPPRWAPAKGYYQNHHTKHRRQQARQVRHDRWEARQRAERQQARRLERLRAERRDRRRTVRHANAGGFDQSWGGGLIGAILGAAAGTQVGKGNGRTAAVIGGGLIGAILGNHIGGRMKQADRERSYQVLETSPTGKTVSWRNPDTGDEYHFTPTRTYRTAAGQDCRDYSTWVFIDGYEEKVQGTACRLPDGRWATRDKSS